MRKKSVVTGIAVLSFLFVAWAGWSFSRRTIAARGAVEAVGSPSHDFGTIYDPVAELEHEFRLRNGGAHPVEISRIRVGCGCLEAVPAKDRLLPGDEVPVRVIMDTRGIVGSRDTVAYVEFRDVDLPALALRVKVYLKPRFAVSVEPPVIAVPRDAVPGAKARETLEVTEYLSHSEAYGCATTVTVDSQDVEILDVEPWEALGWTATRGFMRRTRVRVEYRIPDVEGDAGLEVFTLHFTKVAGQEPAERAEERVTVRRL